MSGDRDGNRRSLPGLAHAMVQRATLLPRRVVGVWVPTTFEEFLDWAPSEGKAEWVDGKGIISEANSIPHGILLEWLGRLLGSYVEFAHFGLVLTQQSLIRLPTRPSGRMPDILVVSHAARHRLGERYLEGPGSFAVELLSEDDPDRDLVEKYEEHQTAGVPEYLIVDARPGTRWFRFVRLGEDGRYRDVPPDDQGRSHSAVLDGLWFDPEGFWQKPLPTIADLLYLIAGDAYDAWLAARRHAWQAVGMDSRASRANRPP